MTIEEILAGESKNVEFKVVRPENSSKYMKTVVAFANGTGGYIVFGIEDNTREIIGIPEEKIFREMDAITNAISDSCEPVIIPDIYPYTIDGKNLIIVEISAGKQRPYYIKADGITDGVYMRVSGTTRKADRQMTMELYYDSESRSYDTVIRKDIKITDGEIKKLCEDMREVALANCRGEAGRQSVKKVTKNVLLSWGILAEDNGNIFPTNAYVYLTGQDTFLSKIQCGVFKGNSREVFLDRREYEGPLWQQVEEAFQFVLRNIHLGAHIEGVYRKDEYELPPDSIRELIINAVVNCSFLQNSHIQIAIYDDRLEITSPGGLMPGVTIERMKEGYSQIRNRALAHAFSYMNLIEGWGTGIPRLLREMREYGLRAPEFIDMEVALRVNLYRKDYVTDGMQDNAGKATFEDEKATSEDEKATSEDEKATFEGEKATSDDEKATFEGEKAMSEDEKATFEGEKATPEEEKAMSEVAKSTLKTYLSKLAFYQPTKDKIIKIYEAVGDSNPFARKDIMKIVGVSSFSAGELINKMIAANLICPVPEAGNGKYCFKKIN